MITSYKKNAECGFLGAEKSAYLGFLFVFGSIAGWLLELMFRSAVQQRLVFPGFLFGPYCPIYGFGVLIIVCLCSHENKLIAYLKIFLLTSVLEYFTSLISEMLFHELLWDYSMLPLSIGTRVSLAFSLAWGALGLAVLVVVQPWLYKMFIRLSEKAIALSYIGVGIIVFDTVISISARLF